MNGFVNKMKRLLDIALSLLALLILSPVILLLSILVALKLGRPVLFRQKRPGLKGKVFEMLKFRSMRDAVDEQGNVLPDSKRLISFGKKLRSTSLDELPSLWSVLKGDMSIVGPRPLSVLHYERDLAQGNVTRRMLKGGLLGLGHINKGTSEMGKADYEYEYIDKYLKYSWVDLLRLDCFIIWKGLILILKGGGH